MSRARGAVRSGVRNDTWVWNGLDGSEIRTSVAPDRRIAHAMAYDAARGRVVMFGGWDRTVVFDDTWWWDGSRWTDRTPSIRPDARLLATLVYDPIRGASLLVGGSPTFPAEPFTVLGDVWRFDAARG